MLSLSWSTTSEEFFLVLRPIPELRRIILRYVSLFPVRVGNIMLFEQKLPALDGAITQQKPSKMDAMILFVF